MGEVHDAGYAKISDSPTATRNSEAADAKPFGLSTAKLATDDNIPESVTSIVGIGRCSAYADGCQLAIMPAREQQQRDDWRPPAMAMSFCVSQTSP